MSLLQDCAVTIAGGKGNFVRLRRLSAVCSELFIQVNTRRKGPEFVARAMLRHQLPACLSFEVNEDLLADFEDELIKAQVHL